jgi:protein Mpv17
MVAYGGCKQTHIQPEQKHDHISHMQLPLVVFGPAVTKWFGFLAQRVNLHSKVTTTAARVLADQTLMASANLFVFLSTMAILEGDNPQKRLERAFWPGMKATWMLWPAVQTVNFTLVPLQYRVLVANVVNLGWNCFLSYLNNRS